MVNVRLLAGSVFLGAGFGIGTAVLVGLMGGCAAVQKHGGTALDVGRCVQDFVETGKPVDAAAALSISACIQEVLGDAIARHDKLTQELTELEAQRVRLLVDLHLSQSSQKVGAEVEKALRQPQVSEQP